MMPESEINPEFLKDAEVFLNQLKVKVLSHYSNKTYKVWLQSVARSKTQDGRPITGRALAALAEHYLEGVLARNIRIESSFDTVVKQENARLIEVIIVYLETRVNCGVEGNG